MMEKFLPIGTVILMKNATKTLMITGYCSSVPEQLDKVYDYVGCLFPEGNLAGDDVALFNHDQIGTIVHMGLNNQEFQELNNKIVAATSTENNTANQQSNSNSVGKEKSVFERLSTTDPAEMLPFTPENINLMLEEIRSQTTVKEPTAFDMEAIKRPKFGSTPSVFGGNNSNNPMMAENGTHISNSFSVDNTKELEGQKPAQKQVISTGDAGEATPVLQLKPIYSEEDTLNL